MPRFITRVSYEFDRVVEVEAETAEQAQRMALVQAPMALTVLGNELISALRSIHGYWDVRVEKIEEDEDAELPGEGARAPSSDREG
jgi:hypothetical protein